MPSWSNDSELFQMMRKDLFSAVLGDVMDTMGLTHQFLSPTVKPIKDDMVIAGRAMPVLEEDIFIGGAEEPFGLMFDALDDLKPNEIYLATGAAPNYALWGGLMSTRAKILGAAGAVLDGYHRDTTEILELGFPCFSMGSYAQDQGVRGKVVQYRCRVKTLNRVVVEPGDIIFGDFDGVVVVPQIKEQEIIEAAVDKVYGENKVREAIEKGVSSKDAFQQYGIM
jgi:4-hydroxy-4-methyl-2-oxoglutarate aldolase